jgi:hypothetical protein
MDDDRVATETVRALNEIKGVIQTDEKMPPGVRVVGFALIDLTSTFFRHLHAVAYSTEQLARSAKRVGDILERQIR